MATLCVATLLERSIAKLFLVQGMKPGFVKRLCLTQLYSYKGQSKGHIKDNMGISGLFSLNLQSISSGYL